MFHVYNLVFIALITGPPLYTRMPLWRQAGYNNQNRFLLLSSYLNIGRCASKYSLRGQISFMIQIQSFAMKKFKDYQEQNYDFYSDTKVQFTLLKNTLSIEFY